MCIAWPKLLTRPMTFTTSETLLTKAMVTPLHGWWGISVLDSNLIMAGSTWGSEEGHALIVITFSAWTAVLERQTVLERLTAAGMHRTSVKPATHNADSGYVQNTAMPIDWYMHLLRGCNSVRN